MSAPRDVIERRFRSEAAWDACRRELWPAARHLSASSTVPDGSGAVTVVAGWREHGAGWVEVPQGSKEARGAAKSGRSAQGAFDFDSASPGAAPGR